MAGPSETCRRALGSLWVRLSKIHVQDQALGDMEAPGTLEAALKQAALR